jgi:hypothetical protein
MLKKPLFSAQLSARWRREKGDRRKFALTFWTVPNIYNEFKAVVDIRKCEIIQGNLPKKQGKLVLAWAEIHQEELLADWQLSTNGELPFKIEPLK